MADVIHNIGGVRAKRGNLDGTVDDYKAALDVCCEYYSHNCLVVAKTMNNLSIVYTHHNKLNTAMGLLKTVLSAQQAHLNPKNKEITMTL